MLNSMLTYDDSCECVCTGGSEDARIQLAVTLRKTLHHPINLLCFTRQTKTPQKLPANQRVRVNNFSNET